MPVHVPWLERRGAVLTEEQLIAADQPSALVKLLEKEEGPASGPGGMLKSQRLAVRSKALDALEDMAGNDFGFDPGRTRTKPTPALFCPGKRG
ncbi:MAG: hypothetical protein ACLSCR_08690 [Akkermansia sp.]